MFLFADIMALILSILCPCKHNNYIATTSVMLSAYLELFFFLIKKKLVSLVNSIPIV